MPAEQTNSLAHLVRFSSFELDLRAGELRKHGLRVKLQDQPLQILTLLLEKPGEVVTREQLRDRLWPADTFVDFDHSLNSAVKKLRQALNDDPDVPRFIETLPRRGYRFIAPLRNGSEAVGVEIEGAVTNGSAPLTAPAIQSAPEQPGRIHHWKLWAAGALGFVLALGLVAWFGFRPARSPSLAPIHLVPLTTYSNGGSRPSFSPDGNQVAYSWSGPTPGNVDIYVKQIGIEKPLQITHDFGYNFIPVWSPEGRYIAFVHVDAGANFPGHPALYLVPALGGPPRKLIELQHAETCNPTLSWSPDGSLLSFSEKPSSTAPCAIYQLTLADLQIRKLSSPPVPSTGDGCVEYSPDGTTLAFVRNTKDVEDIYLMPASGGEPRRLTFDNRLIVGLTWTPDSKEIVFASNRGGAVWSLWRISVRGGTPERVAVGSERAYAPVISLKGHRLAYVSGYWNENIWRMTIGPGRHAAKPEKLIFSDMQEEGPEYSPDGKRIVFQSTRSGNFEIWRADADGSNLVQLTSMGGPLTGTPRWSPDGRWISFDSRPGAHPNIHIVSSDGGPVRRFNNDTSDDGVASWSHDGKWIYFASNRSGSWQVWKRTADGGSPVQVTSNGGFAPIESADGKYLYYTKYDSPGAFRVPVSGGEEVKILDEPPQGYWGYFTVGTDGLYFAGDNGNHKPGLKFYDFATKKTSVVTALDKDPYYGAPGLAVSPDGRSVLYVQLDEGRDNLMLAENFR
ncbi:MAG TPA: winged helix-turn-helix domain-containing protein [Terriglobales bacterium]|nr:winged helix-turn-helix domain-containing protein [Terriglobales bacterium]